MAANRWLAAISVKKRQNRRPLATGRERLAGRNDVRLLLRFLSLLFLAAAIIVGIIDSIQSVAGEAVALTPLGAALFSINPEILAAGDAYFRAHISAYIWDTQIEWILLQPAFLVFLTMSLISWVIAYKREPAGRFSVRQR
jgi:hypothetical protein